MKKNMLKLLALVALFGAISSLTTTLADAPNTWISYGEDYGTGGRNSGPTCISCSIRP